MTDKQYRTLIGKIVKEANIEANRKQLRDQVDRHTNKKNRLWDDDYWRLNEEIAWELIKKATGLTERDFYLNRNVTFVSPDPEIGEIKFGPDCEPWHEIQFSVFESCSYTHLNPARIIAEGKFISE